MYVSEFEHFLNDLKAKDPEIDVGQKKARAIWWDKRPMTAEDVERTSESLVRQNGYVYQTKL
jgi:hypothetical protein